MKKKKGTLLGYLDWYYDNIQEEMMLVHRPTLKNSWANRCLFLSDRYNPSVEYNHRSVLKNEVVIEYDYEDKELNKKLVDMTIEKLRKDKVKYMLWFSGNKSYHLHCLIRTERCSNISLLKNSFCRQYGTYYQDPKDGKIYKERKSETLIKMLPDLRLCADNHLVRAEHGMHEKTKQKKTLVSQSAGYPELSDVSQAVWDRYVQQQRAVVARRFTQDAGNIQDLPGFKYIAASHLFREAEDGRERAMFILIHAMKGQYKEDKPGFIKYVQEWYRYSGGHKMSEQQIKAKVVYHWNKTYRLDRFLNELLESIGKSDLVKN